jgi:metallo-beta-lactamase class B
MNKSICVIAALITFPAASFGQAPATGRGQTRRPAPDHPTISIQGESFTPRSILARNMGTPEEQAEQFPPHKIIGNVYYVGTKTLSSFLIVTPAGNILMDTTYERNVRTIQKSVEQLGFKFSDTKIILGNHAHGDHMEGDALAKELTGAQVIVMAEDVPALTAIKPGGKEHPIDKIIHDGDTVTLGGTTLTAYLTAGHTHGATTWIMKTKDGNDSYDVVFHSSLRSGAVLTPPVVAEFNHSFSFVRSLACDVPLGDHPGEYDMHEKFAKLHPGGPNPFIDRAGCNKETDIEDAMFHAILQEQEQAALAAAKP